MGRRLFFFPSSRDVFFLRLRISASAGKVPNERGCPDHPGRRSRERARRGVFAGRTSTAAETAASSSSTSEERTVRLRRRAWGGSRDGDNAVR
jgi:hypothetical protein